VRYFRLILIVCAALFVQVGSASAYLLVSTTPGKWGDPTLGTGASVTWSLLPTANGYTDFDEFLPGNWYGEVESAFSAWSDVANITFTEIADDGAPFNAATTSGDIRIGGHSMDGPLFELAHGFFPPNNGLSAAGDIHFDISEAWKIGFGGVGYDISQVLMHEIGHAIGLDHELASAALMNSFYTESFYGLLADDIAGAQAIYGAAQSIPELPGGGMFVIVLVTLGAAVLMRVRRHISCSSTLRI